MKQAVPWMTLTVQMSMASGLGLTPKSSAQIFCFGPPGWHDQICPSGFESGRNLTWFLHDGFVHPQ